ncbi:MAG: hypothetical protein RL685_4159 [Pseudomonadota bacterium]|jgi:hypothetical protein
MRSSFSARTILVLRFLLASQFVVGMFAREVRAADPLAPTSLPANSKQLARQRFQEATEAYQEGRYSAAASLFEAADRLRPHASVRFNAAAAWEEAGEEARAASGYAAVLELESLDASRRKTALERLAGLSQKLGRVQIREPLGALVTVDHVQREPVPLLFYLRPGSYDIAAEYRGVQTTTATEISAGSEREIQLDLPLPELPAAAVAPPPAPPQAPRPVDVGPGQKTWGWVSVGASVAFGGAAIFFGVKALSARDRYSASSNQNADARKEASDLRLATNLLWGGATIAGSTGLVLLLTAPTVEF